MRRGKHRGTTANKKTAETPRAVGGARVYVKGGNLGTDEASQKKIIIALEV